MSALCRIVPCTYFAYLDQRLIAPSPSSYSCRQMLRKSHPTDGTAMMILRIEVDKFLTSYKQHTPQRRNTMSRVLYWNAIIRRENKSGDYVQRIRTSPCNGVSIQENPKMQGRWERSIAPVSPGQLTFEMFVHQLKNARKPVA